MTKQTVEAAKKKHPEALFLVHPESPLEVLAEADYVGSTSGIINFATKSGKEEFIVGTELGVLYELRQKNPDKTFYPLVADQICPDMKRLRWKRCCAVCRRMRLPSR